jgi:hypothetical protein
MQYHLPYQRVTKLPRMKRSEHSRWVYGTNFGYTADVKTMKVEGETLGFTGLEPVTYDNSPLCNMGKQRTTPQTVVSYGFLF